MQGTLATEKSNRKDEPVDEDERQYLTGSSLFIVLGSLTLVSFLVLLDMSILGTVSQLHPFILVQGTDACRPSLASPLILMRCLMSVGTSARTT
jgi:hypothetical protein